MKIRLIAAAALLAQAAPTVAGTASEDAVENIIVTGVRTHEPLRLETDPSRPRQPLPAHDGAEYLKTIPGFNIIRKGGTDGDPLFRGMAASRINVLLDGESLLGGCGSRMDPPTAYVFPEAYDRITIIKGPQTVVHGPGNSAATVLFERDKARRETKGVEAAASATLASFGRRDGVLRLSGGSGTFYSEITGTHSRSDNYEDGRRNEVHSRYERSSGNVSLGWTPNETTLLELSAALSDGEAG